MAKPRIPATAKGKKLTAKAAEMIRDMAVEGHSTRQIAAKVGTTTRTVQRELERETELPVVDLRSRDAVRLTGDEITDSIRYVRDLLVDALEAGAVRLAINLRAGRGAKDPAAAVATAADKLRSLDAYLSLSDVMTCDIPDSQEARETAYIRLLWTQAAAGSIPAAKLLARAWGIDALADRGKMVVEWAGDDSDDEGDTPSCAPTTSA